MENKLNETKERKNTGGIFSGIVQTAVKLLGKMAQTFLFGNDWFLRQEMEEIKRSMEADRYANERNEMPEKAAEERIQKPQSEVQTEKSLEETVQTERMEATDTVFAKAEWSRIEQELVFEAEVRGKIPEEKEIELSLDEMVQPEEEAAL